MTAITEFTNAYASAHIAQAPYYGDKNGVWVNATTAEMYKFVATIILFGLNKLPDIEDYWSTKPLFHGNWARAIIPSRWRFKALLCFFKVVNSTAEAADDRLKKVRFL